MARELTPIELVRRAVERSSVEYVRGVLDGLTAEEALLVGEDETARDETPPGGGTVTISGRSA